MTEVSTNHDDAPEDIDGALRRSDPDRWLASRFIADADLRADVVAIYAFDGELARAPRVASNALLGEIRLTWWLEAVAEIYEGRRVRGHPVTLALVRAVERRALPREALERMVEGRFVELDRTPLSADQAGRLAEDTAGHAAELAARSLGEAAGEGPDVARACGRLWGMSRLLLEARLAPEAIDAARSRAVADLRELRFASRRISVGAFPAAAPATFARAYLEGRRLSDLRKRLSLTWATLKGRI